MPQTKNPHLRYRLIDDLLRNLRKEYNFNDLLEAIINKLLDQDQLTIRERQLRKDIKDMRSDIGFSAPVEANNSRKHPIYSYSDPDFSIKENALNPQELAKLMDPLKMLERFEGSSHFLYGQGF